jgi:hypothetical protein
MTYPLSLAQYTRKASSRLIEYVFAHLNPRTLGPVNAKLFENNTIVVIESSIISDNLGKAVKIQSPILCLVAKDKYNKVAYFAPGELYVVLGAVAQTDGAEDSLHFGVVSLAFGQNLRLATPKEIEIYKSQQE